MRAALADSKSQSSLGGREGEEETQTTFSQGLFIGGEDNALVSRTDISRYCRGENKVFTTQCLWETWVNHR